MSTTNDTEHPSDTMVVTRDTMDRLRHRVEAAEAQLATARRALEFYANPETYLAIGFLPDPPCGDFITDESDTGEPYGYRMGKRARAALAEKEPGT